jgi:curved DNA-binding protein CbpA
MNYEDACINLNINTTETINSELIKKKYRILALKYHPDKNKSEDASNRFIEIQESYEYLLRHYNYTDNEKNQNYYNILQTFLNNMFPEQQHSTLIFYIFEKIISKCEKHALNTLNNLDVNILNQLYNIIILYKDSLHINDDIINQIASIIKNKHINKETIILNPTINDLFENNLYKLQYENKTYIIPLWHHELIYDTGEHDFTVKCIPILPNNIQVDNNNNITINLTYHISDIWEKNEIHFSIDNFNFYFHKNQLKLQEKQTIKIYNQGISKINTIDVFNVNNKSNICANITLKL